MSGFLNNATGQVGTFSTDFWCWKVVSQTCGIARDSGDTAGPLIKDDGTLAMVYFMCPKANQKNS
jgi:hypothetical protein